LNNSKIHCSLLFFNKYQFVLYIISFISFELLYPSYILGIVYILLFISCFKLLDIIIPKYENTVLSKVGKKWKDLEHSCKYSLEKIVELDRELDIEYERICENLTYRPPDWNMRRREILIRDNFSCTECGWPKGFQRRSRQLHIHHIRPLSKGGNNSFDNLITLCHICHKKVDKLHNNVRNLRRKLRNK